MQIEFDPDKRDKTLLERGLDFARAGEVLTGPKFNQIDALFDYGEQRFITFGLLDDDWVIVVWTPRGINCRIISMRYANEREISKYRSRMDRP